MSFSIAKCKRTVSEIKAKLHRVAKQVASESLASRKRMASEPLNICKIFERMASESVCESGSEQTPTLVNG